MPELQAAERALVESRGLGRALRGRRALRGTGRLGADLPVVRPRSRNPRRPEDRTTESLTLILRLPPCSGAQETSPDRGTRPCGGRRRGARLQPRSWRSGSSSASSRHQQVAAVRGSAGDGREEEPEGEQAHRFVRDQHDLGRHRPSPLPPHCSAGFGFFKQPGV